MSRSMPLLPLWFLLVSVQLFTYISAIEEPTQCSTIPSVDEVVKLLDLSPSSDGGWAREIFRSNFTVDAPYGKDRSALVSSFYLLQDKLTWHRNDFDETWSYYMGSDVVAILELSENELQTTIMGSHVLGGEVVQHTVTAGNWYAAMLNKTADDDAAYALIGKQTGPGIESGDWTRGNATDLLDQFPTVDARIITNFSVDTFPLNTFDSTRSTTQPLSHSCTFPPIQSLVDLYDLQKHPEGGFFVETYRSDMVVNTTLGPRNAMTSIYYAMFAGNNSDFHRLKSDETWNYYFGETIYLYELVESDDNDDNSNSNLKTIVLGTNLSAGEIPEYTVVAGTWFGAEPNPNTRENPDAYALFGTNVGPGFEYEDWELGNATELIQEFPGAATKILELTPLSDGATAAPSFGENCDECSGSSNALLGLTVLLSIFLTMVDAMNR